MVAAVSSIAKIYGVKVQLFDVRAAGSRVNASQ
jgi:hypothetical protein